MTVTPTGWRNAVTFIHIVLSGTLFFLSIQLFLPTDTYGAGCHCGKISPNWRIIAAYFPDESRFAAVMWAASCVGFVGLAAPHRMIVQYISVGTLTFAHATLAAAFFFGNPDGGGSIFLCGFSVLGIFLLYRKIVERDAW